MQIAELQIKRLNWKVYFEDPKETREETFEDDDCGDTVFIRKRIYLNSTLDEDLLYETIKHELVHAYLYSYGLDQVKFNEENFCDFFATYGDDVLKDAKDLFDICKDTRKMTS